MTKFKVGAVNFIGTMMANLDNEKMSDADFRQFIRNTIPIVEKPEHHSIVNHDVAVRIAKYYPADEVKHFIESITTGPITVYFAKSPGSYKKKNYASLEELKEMHNVRSVCDEDKLIKALKKYTDVYCIMAPNQDDETADILVWELSAQAADDSYHLICEEI